jgi:3-oxoacyl-[acyl-carrier-protein] synthase-1
MPLAVRSVGLVTAVGLTAAASCAALRAKISNPTETRFVDSSGKRIMAHQVELEQPWRGLAKLARMASMAIDEALGDVPKSEWRELPLVLCVAERERPGRLEGLEDELLPMIEAELGVQFHGKSAIVPHGRVGVAVALAGARRLIAEAGMDRVLIAATDGLLTWPTLQHFDRLGRLLAAANSNGFMPGEAAGALLVAAARQAVGPLHCIGFGFGRESAHIDAEDPLRAEGLTAAIRSAVGEAGIAMHDVDYRIADASGEQYYFKEASLALSRLLRRPKPGLALWHPAECAGETGAAAGACAVASAFMAAAKNYGVGPVCLLQFSNDDGRRASVATRAIH